MAAYAGDLTQLDAGEGYQALAGRFATKPLVEASGRVVGQDPDQQAVMAATQSIVYGLRPQARSRINAIFMTLCFAGGAGGSALAGAAWSAGGWTGACVVAMVLAALGLIAQFVSTPHTKGQLWNS